MLTMDACCRAEAGAVRGSNLAGCGNRGGGVDGDAVCAAISGTHMAPISAVASEIAAAVRAWRRLSTPHPPAGIRTIPPMLMLNAGGSLAVRERGEPLED
jgi:hypothetical protein